MAFGQRPGPAKDAAARAFCAANLAAFSIGTPGGGLVNVAVTLQDAQGVSPGQRVSLPFYLASTATGDTITPSAATIAIGTKGGPLLQIVSGKAYHVVSDANGQFDINITATGVTYYLVLIMPDGSLVISSAIVLP